MFNILRGIWFLASIAVLVITLAHDGPKEPNDIGIFLAYGMLILTFPAGFIVVGLIALLAYMQETWGVPLVDLLDARFVGFSVMWLAFFIAGYLQWFVLVPFLLRKWKTRRAGSIAAS